MKTLNIEWRYLDASGKTCARCFDTGKTLKHEISHLNAVLQPRGIQLKLIETKLKPTQIPQSNAVLFDGVANRHSADTGVTKPLQVLLDFSGCGQLLQNSFLWWQRI